MRQKEIRSKQISLADVPCNATMEVIAHHLCGKRVAINIR